MDNNYKIVENDLKSFCVDVLKKFGMIEEDANTMSSHLVRADKWGINTHGTKNLFGYVQKALAKGVSFTNQPEYIYEFASIALLDARNCMGYLAATKAMEKACEMATINGIGMVCVKNSSHYGAGACYANIAAEKGLIGIALSNVDKKMTIPGSKGMVMGHNPFTLAAPANVIPSVFLDSSSSNISSLRVLKAKENHETIPYDWICDKDGIPTNDPSHYPEEGALLPLGGNHKGYGIALFIDILTGVMGSSLNSISDNIPSWCFDLDKPNMVSHTLIAINPNLICPDFKERIDKLIKDTHNLPKAKNVSNIFVPGEMAWAKFKKNEEDGTVLLPSDVVGELSKLERLANIELKKKRI